MAYMAGCLRSGRGCRKEARSPGRSTTSLSAGKRCCATWMTATCPSTRTGSRTRSAPGPLGASASCLPARYAVFSGARSCGLNDADPVSPPERARSICLSEGRAHAPADAEGQRLSELLPHNCGTRRQGVMLGQLQTSIWVLRRISP